MSPALQGAQLFVLAGVAFLALGSLLSAAVIVATRSELVRWDPRARHQALVILAALPVLTAAVLLLSASLPSLIALAAPHLDHCASHHDGHAHLCFVHLPTVDTHVAVLLGLVFVATYSMIRGSVASWSVFRASQILRALVRSADARPDLGVIVMDTSQPLCFAAGLLRPRVFISRGLLDLLSDEQRVVVLAHESAHVQRRDALTVGVVRALSAFHLPSVARWLVQETEIAAEQACDEAAAARIGDRVAVASTILAVERASRHASDTQFASLAVAFAHRAVERRVYALLDEPAPLTSPRKLVIGLMAASAVALMVAEDVHHLTETLLSAVAH